MHVLSPSIPDARVMREAAALVAAGYDVTIVDIEHDAKRPPEETVNGVRVQHAFLSKDSARNYSPTKTLPWLWFKLQRIVRGARLVFDSGADAFHAHDITALPACLIAGAFHRKPVIFDSHELPMTQRHLLERPLVNRVSTALLRTMIRRCAGAITVSPQIVDELRRRFGGPTARLVRNVPEYCTPVNADRFRQEFRLSSDTRIALYQGYFQENRSLDILIRAAQYLPKNIVIVMMGKGEAQAELEALIHELGVEDRVKIKGFVPHDELLSWTASADIGLSAFSPDHSESIRFCLPNKVFEYLMAGLPILTTRLEAIVDLVQRYDVGRIIESTDPKAVADAIINAVADPDALKQMHENALAACMTDLRWDVEARQLINLYGDVLMPGQRLRVSEMQARA